MKKDCICSPWCRPVVNLGEELLTLLTTPILFEQVFQRTAESAQEPRTALQLFWLRAPRCRAKLWVETLTAPLCRCERMLMTSL